MENLFDKSGAEATIERINKLIPNTTPQWGKMSVDQMLAHSNVAFEMTYENKHKKPGAIARFMLKLVVKNAVVGALPYPKNGRTGPQFIINGDRDFDKERNRLISYINQTHQLGAAHFENKENLSFGKMSSQEWNTMFSKHLDHHLKQFGV